MKGGCNPKEPKTAANFKFGTVFFRISMFFSTFLTGLTGSSLVVLAPKFFSFIFRKKNRNVPQKPKNTSKPKATANSKFGIGFSGNFSVLGVATPLLNLLNPNSPFGLSL